MGFNVVATKTKSKGSQAQSPLTQNVTAIQGGTATLTCKVDQNDNTSLQWSNPAQQTLYFDDKKDVPSIKEPDSKGKTFTVRSTLGLQVDRNDDGVAVSCSVDHESLRSSPQVAKQVLDIQYVPSVKIDFSRNFAREGDELRLECRATGNPTPEAVKWKKDGAELPDPDRMVVEGNVLIISALNKTDNGTYYCEAANTMGHNSAEYILFVYGESPGPCHALPRPSIPGGWVVFPSTLSSS
ncbi:cell adhesion molecule 2-like [Chiloscyllium plagiosum]|uniref:cell adhesion molecule 2-like n=1 Tax=Chiloscyllium plagiosum TaxID=36176 RepID=UPI001CB81154|nr:cell adhesion molecule 2-like [Chiloscyllium plagiosum]